MPQHTPAELVPAFDRAIDKDSIDARMGAQLSWEALATPRRRHERRSHGNTVKRAAAGLGILVAAGGVVEVPKTAEALATSAKDAINFVMPSRDVKQMKTPDGKSYEVFTGSYHR